MGFLVEIGAVVDAPVKETPESERESVVETDPWLDVGVMGLRDGRRIEMGMETETGDVFLGRWKEDLERDEGERGSISPVFVAFVTAAAIVVLGTVGGEAALAETGEEEKYDAGVSVTHSDDPPAISGGHLSFGTSKPPPWPAVGESGRIVVELAVHSFGTASSNDTRSNIVEERGPIAHGSTKAVDGAETR